MSKPVRRSNKTAKKLERGGAMAAMEKLFDIEPYHRNEITVRQINRIRDMIDREGRERAAEKVGVSVVTLLAVTSGFGHTLQARTRSKVREFFGE